MADEGKGGPASRDDFPTEWDGLRLVKAFMGIEDPVLRGALIEFAERLAKEAVTNRIRARELMSHALRVFG